MMRGEQLSFFHLGSTVVVLFESPNFQFRIKPGDLIKLGQQIGLLSQLSEGEQSG